MKARSIVVPAKAGTPFELKRNWAPAFAGATVLPGDPTYPTQPGPQPGAPQPHPGPERPQPVPPQPQPPLPGPQK